MIIIHGPLHCRRSPDTLTFTPNTTSVGGGEGRKSVGGGEGRKSVGGGEGRKSVGGGEGRKSVGGGEGRKSVGGPARMIIVNLPNSA